MRNQVLDIAKGVTILMVVWHHTIANFPLNGGHPWIIDLNSFICSFFMPLFFIISGIFIKRQDWPIFLWKKGRGLLIPFIVFYLLGYAIVPVVNCIPWLHTKTPFQWTEIFALFYSSGFRNGALWFLLALFNGLLIIQCLLRIRNERIRVILLLLLFSLGLLEGKNDIILPLYIGAGLRTLLYLYIGYYIGRNNFEKYLVRKNIYIPLCTIFALITSCLSDNAFVIKNNICMGQFLLAIFSALSGSLFIFTLSSLINKSRYLEYCGRTTLPILCVHSLFTQVVSKIILKCMDPTSWYAPLVAFVIVVALTHIAAEFLLRYTPALVGKKK